MFLYSTDLTHTYMYSTSILSRIRLMSILTVTLISCIGYVYVLHGNILRYCDERVFVRQAC